MTDIEIINGYSNDELKGITVTDHCFFMPVRITGLGKTIRVDEDSTIDNLKNELKVDEDLPLEDLVSKAKENGLNVEDFVKYIIMDRKAQDFANDDILEAYQGMPILRDHPKTDGKTSSLDFKNLKDNPIIGSIIKAYRKGEALWGLARIFDIKLIDEFSKYQSTSPAVLSINREAPSGLIIEKPSIFNHLAFVKQGHWDQIDKEPYDASEIKILKQERNMDKAANQDSSDKKDELVNKVDNEVKELQKDVEELQENENSEAEKFEELAEEHNNIKGDEMLKELKDNEVIPNEDNKLDEDTEDKVDENTEDKVDEDTEDKVDENTEDKVDEDTEDKVDEEIDEEYESVKDDERKHLIDSFRQIIDENPNIGLKMPYLGNKRLKPSVVIHKILRANSKMVDSKYQGLILDDSNKHNDLNYSLQVDALNSLFANAEKATNKMRKEAGKGKKHYWENTDKANTQIDRNF